MKATNTNAQLHHPAVLADKARRSEDLQLRIADAVTSFAGSIGQAHLDLHCG